jgi:hypothetical protein
VANAPRYGHSEAGSATLKAHIAMKSSQSRRSVLKHLLIVAGAGSLPGALRAGELPHLDPHEPAAAQLGYVEKAGEADAKTFPSYAPGRTCENCLQLQGESGQAYRPCAVFPGKLVAASGWCASWTPEI